MAKAVPINIDWNNVLHRDDSPAAEVVVISGDGGEADSKGDDLARMSDQQIHDKIQRLQKTIPALKLRLPDGGSKLASQLAQFQDELLRRNTSQIRKDTGVSERDSKPENRRPVDCFINNGNRKSYTQRTPIKRSCNQSGNAFTKELSLIGRDKRTTLGKKEQKSQSSGEEPSRSFSDNTHRKVRSVGYSGLNSSSSSFKRMKTCKPKNSLDFDFVKVSDLVLLDDEDTETLETTTSKEIPVQWQECKIYYPSRNDPDAIELTYSDIKCLEPGEYLSSPVMNFYIQYIKRSQSPTLRLKLSEKFYIFNTYFYQKLEDALTGKGDRSSRFLKLRRWWKGVNIFEKSYIILPIHGSMHWSLAIICMQAKGSELGPIILHMDSLGLHPSSQIFDSIKRYLMEEWHHVSESATTHSILEIQKEKVVVPQQKNDSDCGLFVLYFIERFIREAPERLTNEHLCMFGRKWFSPEEASGLRQRIRELLLEELESVRIENGITESETISNSSDSDEL